MQRAAILAVIFALLCAPAVARSKATEYLVAEQIAEACSGTGGQIDPAAVIEQDLTGDGKDDLIISHEGISCAGGGRSSFCGAQVCAFNVYVRRGALLELAKEMLGTMVSVDGSKVPSIRWYGHGGAKHLLRWDGSSFR